MKRNLIMSTLLLIAGVMFAQQPVITFTKTEHDFGKINEEDGRVTTIFEFKNEGMEPLVLSNVKASCGCTTPSWTRTPVEPGQTGNISVTYNPNGRPGRFQKTVTITSNATVPSTRVYIKGEVIPKSANPAQKFAFNMDGLSLKAKKIDFGNILKGQAQVKSIDYANFTNEPISVSILTNEADPIIAEVTLEKVENGKSGKLNVRFDAAASKVYGPQNYKLYVVVNGKRQTTDAYCIELVADVDEDFSQLTAEQRQNAPILEAQKSVNLGEIAKGKKVKTAFNIKNAGADALLVRRAINADLVNVVAPKSVKSGKSAKVTLEVNGKEAGDYNRIITLITNDPKNPKQTINLTWTVK